MNRQECWDYLGYKAKGYGMIHLSDRYVMAHRVFYEMYVSQIPEGLTLDHLCRNKSCVNPQHLEPVTIKENIRRGTSPSAINFAKTHCNRGHEFTSENTRIEKNGNGILGRTCIKCKAITHKLRKALRGKE